MIKISLNTDAYRAARDYWWKNIHVRWWDLDSESQRKTMSVWLAEQGARVVTRDQPEPSWLAELGGKPHTQGMKSLDVAGLSPGFDYLVFEQDELATAFLLRWG